YFAFALGAALAFAVLVGVMAIFPGAGGDLTVWGTVFGFMLLIVVVFAGIKLRLRQVETRMAIEQAAIKNNGQLLAGEVVARRAAEAALREEMLLPQFNPGPVVRFNAQGIATRANKAAGELVTGQSIEGKPVRELLPAITEADLADILAGRIVAPV